MTLLEKEREGFAASEYGREYFEGHLARYKSPVYRQRVKFVDRFMDDVTGARVLDLGCGVGFFGGMARRRGAIVAGLDFSEVALELCRGEHEDIAVVRGDATCVPFAANTFDLVLVNDIIEHLSEEAGRNMVTEAFRVLRPGGSMILDTDNDRHLMGFKGLRRINAWLERKTPQRRALAEIKQRYTAPTLHVRIYAASELRSMLEGAGFRIDRFETYPYIAVPARDALLNLPLVRIWLRELRGDVQIWRARKP